MQTQNLEYRPDIDGLRAIAVLSVMLVHFGATWLPGGFVGVDIFFVISGFLITAIIGREMDQGRFSFAKFYQRRFRRIFPALWIVLLSSLSAACYLMSNEERIGVARSATQATISLSNIYFWKHLGYFEGGADETPLLHTWSLSVEEQYYIFFPIFLLLAHRHFKRHLPAILMTVVMLSLAVSVVLTYTKPSAAFYLPVSRANELFLGAFFALIPRARIRPDQARWLCITGLALCFGSIFLFHAALPFPGALALIPCVGTAMLLYFGSTPNTMSEILGREPITAIGRISYSLYLWHWPILVFYKYYVMHPLTPAETAGLLAATFVMANLSYRLIETRFRAAGKHASLRRDAVLAIAMSASVIIPSKIIVAYEGFPDPRMSAMNAAIQHDLAKQDKSPCLFNMEQGAEAIPSLDVCQLRKATTPAAQRILLWGDSYANHYVDEILSNPALSGIDITYLTHSSCPPYLQHANHNCNSFNQAVLKTLESRQFDTVIMSANWWAHSRSPDHLKNLAQTIGWLRERNIKTFVIGASPVFHARVPQIVYRDMKFGNQQLSEYRIEFDSALDQGLENAVRPYASYFSPYRELCHGDICRFRDEAGLFQIDQGHLSEHGAHLLFNRFLAANKTLVSAR
jgi:peptidoglycan/LPS O-acetylase OafA/YrhL